MLVPGICTQCGATLSVDKEKDAMVCPYCDTPFIVEKAIQNFTNVYNITAQNVYVQGNIENEYKVEGGVLTQYTGESLHIKIPQGVKKIGDKVFEGLMIESVELSNEVVEIGSFAFRNCKRLKSFTFPTNLETMGCKPFEGCDNLESIYVSSKMFGKIFFEFGSLCDATLIKTCSKLVNIYVDGERLQADDHRLVFFSTTPIGYPYYLKRIKAEQEKKEKEEKQRIEEQRKAANRCIHCGGIFEGIFIKKCSQCKKGKDY